MSRSLAKITRLGRLSREIRKDYESLQQLLERTRQNCNAVISETILLGTKLAEAKQLVGHGNWLEWLAKNCSQITARTAQNYIRLANTKHVSHLESRKSLRQAYLAIGILIPSDEPVPTPAVDVPPPMKKIALATGNGNSVSAQPVIEATVIESSPLANKPPPVVVSETSAETPVTRVKSKVGDLMQCLKPLDAPCRKKVAVHLKPLVIFYHRFGK